MSKGHIRLDRANEKLVAKAAKLNRRSLAKEANHAIADHYLRLGVEKLKAQQV